MRRVFCVLLTVFILMVPLGTWGENEEVVAADVPAYCLSLPGRAEPLLEKKGNEPMASDWPVQGGDRDGVDLVAHEDASLLLNRQAGQVERRLDVEEPLTAPLSAEETVGSAVFTLGGEEVFSVPLYPAADVASHALPDLLRRVAASYLRAGS